MTVVTVRTLPIRVDPVAGESIQSWLRMLAHRNEVTWSQIVRAVGLHQRRGDGTRTPWAQRLHPHEVTAVAHATAVEPAVLHAMTLAVFDGIGISTGRRPTRPDYGALHGLRNRSRYCPRCLDDSGGRWQLRWHLGYSFVCVRHGVLLDDTCPGCGHPPQPGHPTALAIPQPLHCEHRIRRDGATTVCRTDLRAGHLTPAGPTEPMLTAQRIIDEVIDRGQARFGIYAAKPATAHTALADLRLLATRIHRQHTRPGDGAAETATETTATSGPAAPAGAPVSSAWHTAVALTAAVEVLAAADPAQAGQRLRPLIASTRADGRSASASSVTSSRRPVSTLLTAVQLHAMTPWLNPVDQLRYRIADQPRVPQRPAATLARATTSLPALLWPEVAVRLCEPTLDLRAVQAAMSVSVALVGSREPLSPIAALLGHATSSRAVSHIWSRIRETGGWDTIQRAVIRLADYIADRRVPIDYHRRRALDCTDLLTDSQWRQICRTTDTSTARPALAAVARTVLYTRLSGCPAEHAPWFDATPGFKGRLTLFRAHTTPLLRRQLDDVATDFLAKRRICEPMAWTPPNGLLTDLTLPGPDPDFTDIHALHMLLHRPAATIAHAARQLQTSPDYVSHLIDTHPCPPHPKPLRGKQMRRIPGLTPGALAQQRADHGDNLAALARHHDMSRQTLTRIAATLGVSTQPQVGTRLPGRTRGWVERHYVREHRTLTEVAQLAGVSATTVARWLRFYNITARPRGAPSHRSVAAARRAVVAQPTLLQPALGEPLGRQRLLRFAAAMHHPTLRAAAYHLNTTEPVLSQQLRRLETQFGTALYYRAQRGHPMRPTTFGTQVIAALTGPPAPSPPASADSRA